MRALEARSALRVGDGTPTATQVLVPGEQATAAYNAGAIALLSLQAGDTAAARVRISDATGDDPLLHLAQFYLAWHTGDVPQAIERLEAGGEGFTDLVEGPAPPDLILGWLWASSGDAARARTHFERAQVAATAWLEGAHSTQLQLVSIPGPLL